ncbi:MAG: CBS domain-containing protein, partial [Magnetococcales bacterium]|nr:CBS domain-containing protein [Magnetococcales bacterium]
MTTIEPLIRSHPFTVEPYAGVEVVEELLLSQGFLVVMDGVAFQGLLVADDILERRHGLVIDCLRPKPAIGAGESLRRAFALMKRHRLPVLPVVEGGRFIGVVTQSALLEHLAERGDSFERQIAAHARELWSLNQSLTAEIALRKRAENRAQEANRAKSRFLADVSHEIRTPLHVVVGLCQRLGEQAARIDPDALTGQLRRIQEAGEHLFGLVERMLDLARIEAGLVTIRPEPLEPTRFLEGLTAWFVPEARARGNRLESRVDAGIGTVMADPLRLRQVLFNLLANANRHTERGEITLALSLVRADAARRMLRFEVEDTGCGIPAERMESLFEPFILGAGGAGRADGGHGVGLGLKPP